MKYEIKNCPVSRLRKLSRMADGYLRKCIKDFRITENQLNILFVLRELGKIEQGKIGEELVLERSTVSRNVKLLEKNEWVMRTPDYRPEIELTNKGEELVSQIIPHWEKFMDLLVDKIGVEGVELIESLEHKLK